MKFTKNGATIKNEELLEISIAIREGAENFKRKNCPALAKHYNEIANKIYYNLEEKGYFTDTAPF